MKYLRERSGQFGKMSSSSSKSSTNEHGDDFNMNTKKKQEQRNISGIINTTARDSLLRVTWLFLRTFVNLNSALLGNRYNNDNCHPSRQRKRRTHNYNNFHLQLLADVFAFLDEDECKELFDATCSWLLRDALVESRLQHYSEKV
jgi:hypothetical protein